MTFEIKKSTQFKINELAIVSKAGIVDISGIFEEISFFDSIFSPVRSGKILITDSIGLSGKLLFDGSESLLVDIVKSENSDVASYRKAYRIYKQTNRRNSGLNRESYLLHFVSDEFIFSNQQRINQSYNGTYSKVVEKILLNYLKVPGTQLKGIFESTYGVRNVVVPNLKPLEAIDWCCKRSVDQNQAPNFIFFENYSGFNFVTLSTLLSQEDILEINFETKNQSKTNSAQEMSSARAFQVVEQNDAVKKIQDGINAAQFLGFDPLTGVTATKQITFGDVYNSMKHGNQTPNHSSLTNRSGVDFQEAFASKKILGNFQSVQELSSYIKTNSPEIISKLDNIENYIVQRSSIINNLMSKRLKIVMPGNFQLSSGFNVNLLAPTFSKKEIGGDNEDPSLSGKYIITSSRQIIGYDKHETIIEVATTSTNNDFIPASNPQQTSELLTYV